MKKEEIQERKVIKEEEKIVGPQVHKSEQLQPLTPSTSQPAQPIDRRTNKNMGLQLEVL